jgi:integrase
MAKQRGRNSEKLRTGEYYDRVKDRYRARTSAGKMIAGKHLPELRRKVRKAERDGTPDSGSGVRDSVTLAEYAEHWADDLRDNGKRSWKHLRGLVVNHVVPHLGHMQLRDIGQREARAWLKKVNRWMDLENKEPKTVHDIHRAFSSLMGLAVSDEVIFDNVCKNEHVRRLLPEQSEEKPPCYDDKQAWALMTDESIPWDRRMMNTIQALTGCRVGEAAGLRWSKYDLGTPELGCLLIDKQYQDQPLKSARGRSHKSRKVPVHPQLARALRAWREAGYASIFGRPPTADGFIVPDRRNPARARTPKQVVGQHRTDIKRLSFYKPKMGTHSFRRYFETYATLGGARDDMLERITHNKRGTIVNAYIDQDKLWPRLCEAVLCLEADLSRGQVISLEARRGL